MSATMPTEEVISGVAADLQSIGLTMVTGGVLSPTLETTIRDVLEQTRARIERNDLNGDPLSVRYAVTADFANIATTEAESERHPAEPLMAAEVLFDVALPLVSSTYKDVSPLLIAKVLHNEIWRRFPPGAIAYVEIILARLARANREERGAIARDLHDRIGHRLANALQRIELENDAAGHAHNLDIAEQELRASLVDIQDLATALRPMALEKSIEAAVDELAQRLPERPLIRVTSIGPPKTLLASVKEELFAVVVEAVRNARRHARCNEVAVGFQWSDAQLALSIADDGIGFDETGLSAPSGLRSMKERAQIVGAGLDVESSSLGTSVTLLVPLGRVTAKELD